MSQDASLTENLKTKCAHDWSLAGSFGMLHRMNEVRLSFIRTHALNHWGTDEKTPHYLEGRHVLDVGCGVGILSEPLKRSGGIVTGIDQDEDVLWCAHHHSQSQNLTIDYHCASLAAWHKKNPKARYDMVTALEVIEHVAHPQAFLKQCRAFLKPQGLLMLSTLNRNLLSWGVAIVGAEAVAMILHSFRCCPLDWNFSSLRKVIIFIF